MSADTARVQNTLQLPAVAAHHATPESLAELEALLQQPPSDTIWVVGEGSNLVMRPRIGGLVIQPKLRGIDVVSDHQDEVLVDVAAGEHWDDLVAHAVAQGWYGLENLSAIPGSVGAAPYQNIGAYGVELSDVLAEVEALELATGARHCFSREDCAFAYRDSRFKSLEPGRWIIVRVRLCLSKVFKPVLGYADLADRFAALPESQRNAQGMRQMVTALRAGKLPDPAQLANVGSFFKNPQINRDVFEKLRNAFPEIVAFPLDNGGVKLAAGWLIERAGWKGKRLGPVGMHEHQALVLVNHGGASFEDVMALAGAVRSDVDAMFGVQLEQEPVILPPAD